MGASDGLPELIQLVRLCGWQLQDKGHQENTRAASLTVQTHSSSSVVLMPVLQVVPIKKV